MKIGDKINELLLENRRSVNELAASTNISANTLYSIIKRNNTKVDLDVLQRIAQEFNVTLDYFVSDSTSESNYEKILIGKKIEAARLQKGLTQKDVGDLLGVSSTLVNNWEKDISRPDISLLCALMAFLGIEPNHLFNIVIDPQREAKQKQMEMQRILDIKDKISKMIFSGDFDSQELKLIENIILAIQKSKG